MSRVSARKSCFQLSDSLLCSRWCSGASCSSGHFEVIIEAAPLEFMMLFGAAVGAMIIANDMNGLKGVMGGVGMVMYGP